MKKILLIVSLLALPSTVYCGALDDFEKEATQAKNPSETKPATTPRNDDPDDDLDDDFWDFIFDIVSWPFRAGGNASAYRMQAQTPEGVKPRVNGEWQIPLARLELFRQELNLDVSSFDFKAEVGHGQLGLSYAYTRYNEPTDDTLTFHQAMLLYRMSYGKVEIDAGLGYFGLNGNNYHDGSALTLATYWPVARYVYLQLATTGISINNAEGMDIQEGALVIGRKDYFVKIGYRDTTAITTSLYGPYVGTAISW